MYHHFIHGFDDMDLPFQILKLMNVFEDDRRHVNELEDQISALEDERASAASEEVQTLNRTMFDLNAECKSKVAMLGEQLSDAQAQLDLNQGIRHSEFFYRASSLRGEVQLESYRSRKWLISLINILAFGFI